MGMALQGCRAGVRGAFGVIRRIPLVGSQRLADPVLHPFGVGRLPREPRLKKPGDVHRPASFCLVVPLSLKQRIQRGDDDPFLAGLAI